jgi:hypothetical protein
MVVAKGFVYESHQRSVTIFVIAKEPQRLRRSGSARVPRLPRCCARSSFRASQ